jgi:hypothetical protein
MVEAADFKQADKIKSRKTRDIAIILGSVIVLAVVGMATGIFYEYYALLYCTPLIMISAIEIWKRHDVLYDEQNLYVLKGDKVIEIPWEWVDKVDKKQWLNGDMKISFARRTDLGTYIIFPTQYYDNIREMSRKVLDLKRLSTMSRYERRRLQEKFGLVS